MPRRRTQGLKTYRTGLWSLDPRGYPKPPYRGRGWHVDIRVPTFVVRDEEQYFQAMLKRYGYCPPILESVSLPDGQISRTHASELLIRARSRFVAQRAANLILAAILLQDAQLLVSDEIIAFPGDESDPEDLHPLEISRLRGQQWSQSGLAKASCLAAKASHRKLLKYALLKYWMSHRICSVPWMEFHPDYSRRFGVEPTPENHVILAQSIVAAYGAIEELGFDVRASQQRPSMKGGRWNPRVKAHLENRLRRGGIDLTERFDWTIRGTPTRIERTRPVPAGPRPRYARGSVRDRWIQVVDAIAYASWLRSKVSAHRISNLSTSLTPYEVHNVQMLARRLLLETMGFWRKL